MRERAGTHGIQNFDTFAVTPVSQRIRFGMPSTLGQHETHLDR